MKKKIMTTIGDGTTVEIEYQDTAEAWAALVAAQEAFSTEPCGVCGGTDVYRRIRGSGVFAVHELACRRCGAVLQYARSGQSCSLRPRRLGGHHNGWVVCDG